MCLVFRSTDTAITNQGDLHHVEHAPSQWEMTLHCNVISHWLGTYTKWSLGSYHDGWADVIFAICWKWQNTICVFIPDAVELCQTLEGSSLVQILACHLLSTKPLSNPMLIFQQLDAIGWCWGTVFYYLFIYHFFFFFFWGGGGGGGATFSDTFSYMWAYLDIFGKMYG